MFTRDECLVRLRAQVAAGRPVIGGGAGTGISAKFAERGGVDLIIIYNSGRFRMAGRGSLAGLMPYGDANGIVLDMAREVLPVVTRTPVIAGVQNFPTVGLIDGTFRQNLEETGMGFGPEVDMIRQSAEIGLLTTPYAFNPDEAAAMAKAGCDILIPHMGLTTKGSIGASTAVTLEEAAQRCQAMHDAARRVKTDVLVLCHGGPIAEPEDAQYILDHTEGIVGFYGASSMERLPVETALTERTREFSRLRFRAH